jgi:isopenicillin N synthase-like dioxygenase
MDTAFRVQVSIAQAITSALQLISTEDSDTSTDEVSYVDAIAGGETISLMRLFHYFSLKPGAEGEPKPQLGSSPHTDWGFLTVILHDGVRGLQFYHYHAWHDVPTVKSSVVINGGDFLQLLSRGRYRSPIHRVLVPPPEQERMSFVLFFYPQYQTPMPDMSCAQQDEGEFEFNTLTCSALNYSGMSFGDYIVQKWKGVFSDY